jgi:CRP-like cAMP-binding protein
MIAIMSNAIGSETLADLFAGGRLRTFAAGERLFARGDPVVALHFVVAGEARLVRHRPDGGRLVLQRAGPGAVLAEASLFATSYHCDGEAATPLTTRALPVAEARARLATRPELALAWAARLAHEVQRARQRAEILALPRLAERLEAWLALADGCLPPRGRWRELAAELGVTPEALYRRLARLRRAGEPLRRRD